MDALSLELTEQITKISFAISGLNELVQICGPNTVWMISYLQRPNEAVAAHTIVGSLHHATTQAMSMLDMSIKKLQSPVG